MEWYRIGAQNSIYIESAAPLLREWAEMKDGREALICANEYQEKGRILFHLYGTSAFVYGCQEDITALNALLEERKEKAYILKIRGHKEDTLFDCCQRREVENLTWVYRNLHRFELNFHPKAPGKLSIEEAGEETLLLERDKRSRLEKCYFGEPKEKKASGYLKKIRGKCKSDRFYLPLPSGHIASFTIDKQDHRLMMFPLVERQLPCYSNQVDWLMLKGLRKKELEILRDYLPAWRFDKRKTGIYKNGAWEVNEQSVTEDRISEVYEAMTRISPYSGKMKKEKTPLLRGVLFVKCSELLLLGCCQPDRYDKEDERKERMKMPDFVTVMPQEPDTEETAPSSPKIGRNKLELQGLTEHFLTRHIQRGIDKRPIHISCPAMENFRRALELDSLEPIAEEVTLKSGWVRICNCDSPLYLLVGKLSACKGADKKRGLWQFVVAPAYQLPFAKIGTKVTLADVEVLSKEEAKRWEEGLKN